MTAHGDYTSFVTYVDLKTAKEQKMAVTYNLTEHGVLKSTLTKKILILARHGHVDVRGTRLEVQGRDWTWIKLDVSNTKTDTHQVVTISGTAQVDKIKIVLK